ncbi:MAG TPA: riboflavin biosynthesis protein RibF [Bryobacteraceae bacterium]|jgi:riboflavin kinase/FMN adenylyltransferase|nr:riboflavin biosynthesis protein RibF [Bryobacteraceae bacterium]
MKATPEATVFRNLESARDKFEPCELAIGNFDGVHIGHQELIRRTVTSASANDLVPAVLTFDPHPAAIVAPERMPLAIVSLAERLRLLSVLGIRQILVLPFTAPVARMTPEEFVKDVLAGPLRARAVFVGENFRFGAHQAGNAATLRDLGEAFGFATHFLPPVVYRGEVVSSSATRRHLLAGNVDRAARLLGRCFSVKQPVVQGHGIGSKQTVPTLNIKPAPGQVLPRGVYVTETVDTDDARRWPSITNCGVRPTFGGDEVTVETYLLGPLDGETPKHIEVQFRHFVRPERAFPDAAKLKEQILRDVAKAQTYWRRAAGSGTRLLRYT